MESVLHSPSTASALQSAYRPQYASRRVPVMHFSVQLELFCVEMHMHHHVKVGGGECVCEASVECGGGESVCA